MESTNIHRQTHTFWLLAALLAFSDVAQATCNASILRTRPDSRYEVVVGATPVGSEVRDKVTGLVWQRCVLGMVWNASRLTCEGTASSLTWQSALNAALNAGLSAGGTNDEWRLPNHAELHSLAERACDNPAINTTWFPATPADRTWSSSPFAGGSDNAWDVDFGDGVGNGGVKGNAFRVRLVRSGQ